MEALFRRAEDNRKRYSLELPPISLGYPMSKVGAMAIKTSRVGASRWRIDASVELGAHDPTGG